MSLESSERIRQSQKDLIFILQKSNAMGDAGSVMSINSMSTIYSKDGQSLLSSTPSLAAENKSW